MAMVYRPGQIRFLTRNERHYASLAGLTVSMATSRFRDLNGYSDTVTQNNANRHAPNSLLAEKGMEFKKEQLKR